MGENGNSPFVGKPVKIACMWRDMERRAAEHGLPIAVPAPYSLAELELANRIAVLGEQEGWCADYVRATYRRWFQAGEAPGEAPNLPAGLAEIGRDPDDVTTRAQDEAVGAALAANTDAVKAAGVFGSPSFVVGGELFWGDDRLEAALAWTGRYPAIESRRQASRPSTGPQSQTTARSEIETTAMASSSRPARRLDLIAQRLPRPVRKEDCSFVAQVSQTWPPAYHARMSTKGSQSAAPPASSKATWPARPRRSRNRSRRIGTFIEVA